MKFKNEYQESLYNGLRNLVKSCQEFQMKTEIVKNGEFQIFNYLLAGYENFHKYDFAKDSRGTMFFIPFDERKEVQLVALPMKKFFSIGEGMSHEIKSRNLNDVKEAYVKEDGSLITSYVSPVDQELHFKSKKSVEYLHLKALNKAINEDLKKELKELYVQQQICVDMEFTSPENRVIKEYKNYDVHILKARSLINGDDVNIRTESFAKDFPNITKHLVKKIELKDLDIKRKDIEGFVVIMNNGEMFKIKTLPYLSIVSAINFQALDKLHINFYDAAVNEMMDEVRTLIHYKNRSDGFPLEKLILQSDLVEAYAQKTYIPMKKEIEDFIFKNKDLTDNDFLEKAKKECYQYIGPLMTIRKNGKFDLENFAVKTFGKGAKAEFLKAENIIKEKTN